MSAEKTTTTKKKKASKHRTLRSNIYVRRMVRELPDGYSITRDGVNAIDVIVTDNLDALIDMAAAIARRNKKKTIQPPSIRAAIKTRYGEDADLCKQLTRKGQLAYDKFTSSSSS
jgi:histone H3/H4